MFTIWYMGHSPKISLWTSVLVELVLFNLFSVKYVIINFPPVFFKVNSKRLTLAVAIIIYQIRNTLNENFAALLSLLIILQHFEYKSWKKGIKIQTQLSVVWIKDHLIWEEGQVLLTSGM